MPHSPQGKNHELKVGFPPKPIYDGKRALTPEWIFKYKMTLI